MRISDWSSDVCSSDLEEYGGGVGRADDGADEQTFQPRQVEYHRGEYARERRRDEHTDGRQSERRPERDLKACSRRPQTAIEQDDRKRDAARHVSELEIVELDAAWPVLAGEHPETEEQEQQRSADAGGNQPQNGRAHV